VASADSITLQFQHESAKARLIARDSYTDLALLEVIQEGSRTFMGTSIPIGDIRLVETDNRIVSPAFEDVAGFLEKRILKGRITQKTGQKGDPRVFQTDLPAGRPRNGAPVLNEDFQVIGILVDVAKNPFSKTSAMIPEGSSYVVKINNFFNLAASCRECPKLLLTETNPMINELTVFYSVVLVRAEGTK
jgi:S1-C subfamily serine protease